MKVIARMMVRGFGSSLKRKNAYPILGEPMLWWALTEAKKAKFIDDIFVWTEDEELAEITQECGCHVIPRTRDLVFYNGGFTDVPWYQVQNEFIMNQCGTLGDVQVALNCNLCLMTADIMEELFDRLMQDERADRIIAVSKVDPCLYMVNSKTKALFPVWAENGLPKKSYPDLYKKSGMVITHNRRYNERGEEVRRIFHEVPPEYLLDVHDLEDVKLAEYYLMRRLGGKVVPPEEGDDPLETKT